MNYSFICLTFALALSQAAEIKPDKYLAHIKYLASDELQGRLTGSPELEKSRDLHRPSVPCSGLKIDRWHLPATLLRHGPHCSRPR